MSFSTILALIPQLLTGKIFGVPISTIIAWFSSAQGQAAITVFKGVMTDLQKNGDSEILAGMKTLAMIAKIHKMTPAEEKIWMDRASDIGTGG